MASIEQRARGDGTVAFRVVWRDPTQPGRQSMTFDDRRQADQTVKLLDANGQRLMLAVEVANAIRQGGPTVEDVVREHIELLNRVGEDTRTGYRLRARDHITPHIGALPVKALTWQQVTLWIRELQTKGLSHKSIANVHGLLSAAINTAVRLGYRAENPCAAVRLPRSQRAGDDMVVLEPEELDLILDDLISLSKNHAMAAYTSTTTPSRAGRTPLCGTPLALRGQHGLRAYLTRPDSPSGDDVRSRAAESRFVDRRAG